MICPPGKSIFLLQKKQQIIELVVRPEVVQDLLELRSAFPIVPLYHCIEVFCESLLCSEEKENIQLVQEMFDYSPADALFKVSQTSIASFTGSKLISI